MPLAATRSGIFAPVMERPGRRTSPPLPEPTQTSVPLDLQGAEQTVLGPLHARALDARRLLPLLGDEWSSQIASRLAFDFSTLPRPTLKTVVRTLLFDSAARDFLDEHPGGTVVDVGAGLNPRFERVDNGRVHWFDVDQPRVIALRRLLLADQPRRRHFAGSLLDRDWLEQVATTAGPHCFLFEAVLGYLPCSSVRPLLAQIAQRFSGATIAFDLYPRWVADRSGELHVAAADALPLSATQSVPMAIARHWELGRVAEIRTFLDATRRVDKIRVAPFQARGDARVLIRLRAA